jgi:hypothetical protein
MNATIDRMAKKSTGPDRHKPRRMVSIPERVAAVLAEVGRGREASLSETVKVACIAYLESLNRWPPPPVDPKPATRR